MVVQCSVTVSGTDRARPIFATVEQLGISPRHLLLLLQVCQFHRGSSNRGGGGGGGRGGGVRRGRRGGRRRRICGPMF